MADTKTRRIIAIASDEIARRHRSSKAVYFSWDGTPLRRQTFVENHRKYDFEKIRKVPCIRKSTPSTSGT